MKHFIQGAGALGKGWSLTIGIYADGNYVGFRHSDEIRSIGIRENGLHWWVNDKEFGFTKAEGEAKTIEEAVAAMEAAMNADVKADA